MKSSMDNQDKITILVVEDEDDIRDLICYSLGKEGYRALGAASGEEGLKLLEKHRIDLALLDIMLPGMNGYDTLKKIREGDEESGRGHTPVIMLTAKGEDDDIVKGLEIGADDYITKPFSPRVLMARVRTRLKPSIAPDRVKALLPEAPILAGGLRLDIARHELRATEGPIELSATEFALMEFFMSNPGWVFSRSQIIEAVRGSDYPVTDRAVDVQILGLRKKLGRYEHLVETVRGVGYRFMDND